MMRCQDYLQLDPRTWTPMVIWLMNDPFSCSRRSGPTSMKPSWC
jgi:hypothetical protein